MEIRSVQTRFRLFFALKPSPLIARQTDHYAKTIAGGAQRIAVDHQHVTLVVTCDYDDYPYAVIKALLRAGTGVMAEPFDLRLDKLSIGNSSAALRPSHRVPLLYALQRQIAAKMRGAGVATHPGWSFSPHQTLFYRKGRPDQQRVDGFCWHVDQFMLVCSHVGRTHHETLATWSLSGSGQYSLF
ncbi:2'-5' RNA ligase family protein [Sphingobium sp. EM0848]|uniref:2'-5' RNA ligase family protein n=1 Tax=Sphingobium sp. EM0848 TaxID=2743473 RepID=UPI00159C823B|nr:2'-5' RNA ligase family protein [Sphingobium sp. EM0848]